jgi:hypothetical protein
MVNVRWLAILPFLGILIGVSFTNSVEPFVLGIPFVLAWIVGWVLLSSLIMGIIYFFDPINAAPRQGDEGAGR